MKTLGLMALVLATCTCLGCSDFAVHDTPVAEVANEKGEAFGSPSRDERFAPFQGQWKFESRMFDPPIEGNRLSGGAGLNIKGHVIQFGTGSVSFRLCQARQVDSGIEADAFRVDEDEPGEVQRFECKLKMIGDNLEYRWRAVEPGPSAGDPIVAAADYTPPNRPIAPDSPWWIELYSKKSGE